MTATDKFDRIVDMVAEARGIMGADLAAAAEGDKETYLRLEAWLASKGYRPVVVGAKVTYMRNARGRMSR